MTVHPDRFPYMEMIPVRTEPVLIQVAVVAAMNLAVSFGFELTGEQVAAINGFAAAVLGLIVRQRVTPVE